MIKVFSGYTPLMLAIMLSYVEVTKVLLSYGANVNAVGHDGDTPLSLAVRAKSSELVCLLLGRRADPNVADVFGETPLMKAVKQGDLELFALLLDGEARWDVLGVLDEKDDNEVFSLAECPDESTKERMIKILSRKRAERQSKWKQNRTKFLVGRNFCQCVLSLH